MAELSGNGRRPPAVDAATDLAALLRRDGVACVASMAAERLPALLVEVATLQGQLAAVSNALSARLLADAAANDAPRPRGLEHLLDVERLRTAGRPDFVGPAAERVTFDDLARIYLDDYRVNGKRSLRDAQRNVETLRATFGDWKALDITTDHITAYTGRRLTPMQMPAGPSRKAVRPATVNRELCALKRMFALAMRAGKLASRPHVPLLAEENAREGFLEPADFAVLRSHLPPWLADAATFAYLTGWRRGEVATLEWRDVSLATREIRLRSEHSKTKRPRVVNSQASCWRSSSAARIYADWTCPWPSTGTTAHRSVTSAHTGGPPAVRRVTRASSSMICGGRPCATWCAPASPSVSRWPSPATARVRSSIAMTSRPTPISTRPPNARRATCANGPRQQLASLRSRLPAQRTQAENTDRTRTIGPRQQPRQVPTRPQLPEFLDGPRRSRTCDPLIKSPIQPPPKPED
jgi:hypothetical protein